MIHVAIINHATVVSDLALQPMVRALQTQVGKDFYPAWGINATLTHIYPPHVPPATSWVLGIFDDADQADALGYHDVTPKGLPLAKVFARTARQDQASISVVMSHELLEMLADPWINIWIMDAIDPRKFWIREVGDPVEADGDGYFVDGVLLSNFVLPSYFQPDLSIFPFDFKKQLNAPVPSLRSGGYMSYVENGQIGQVYGAAHRPLPGKIGGSGRVARALSPRRVSSFPLADG